MASEMSAADIAFPIPITDGTLRHFGGCPFLDDYRRMLDAHDMLMNSLREMLESRDGP